MKHAHVTPETHTQHKQHTHIPDTPRGDPHDTVKTHKTKHKHMTHPQATLTTNTTHTTQVKHMTNLQATLTTHTQHKQLTHKHMSLPRARNTHETRTGDPQDTYTHTQHTHRRPSR